MMKSDAQREPKSGAERMRETRQRRRAGVFGVVPLELHRSDVAALVARGLLSKADDNDRGAIEEALGRLLDAVLYRRRDAGDEG